MDGCISKPNMCIRTSGSMHPYADSPDRYTRARADYDRLGCGVHIILRSTLTCQCGASQIKWQQFVRYQNSADYNHCCQYMLLLSNRDANDLPVTQQTKVLIYHCRGFGTTLFILTLSPSCTHHCLNRVSRESQTVVVISNSKFISTTYFCRFLFEITKLSYYEVLI